jgi:hypothetical protein
LDEWNSLVGDLPAAARVGILAKDVTSIEELLKANATEYCFGCGTRRRCGCDIAFWCQLQADWMHKVQICKMDQKGYGIRAMDRISKGTAFAEYTGRIRLTDESPVEVETRYLVSIPVGQKPKGRKHPTALIDAFHAGSWARFLNHSCEPNAELDACGRYGSRRICAVVAKRNIKAGEEITIDYGREFTKKVMCYCGTKSCWNPSEWRMKMPKGKWGNLVLRTGSRAFVRI